MIRNFLSLILVFAVSLFFLPVLSAQVRLEGGENYYKDKKGIIYERETTFDIKVLQTNGFAFGLNFGKIKTYYKTQFYNIEFGELKHIREVKQSSQFIQGTFFTDGSRSFIYGKQNNFYPIRLGYGEKIYLSEKGQHRGLAVGVSYSGGANIGILKPYYMDFLYRDVNSPTSFSKVSIKYTPENEDIFLNINSIYGASPVTKGLSEISVRPGLHLKGALHLDWGAFDEVVKAMEAGFMVDYFFGSVPIMVESPNFEGVENSPLLINLYINLQLGKRK